MFGYIKVYQDDLKYREYSLYRYHYCELCRNMGSFSTISRIFLSYDITFFLMLGDPNTPDCSSCTKCNIVTCKSKKTDGIYNFFAALSIVLIYHKLNNDVIDGDIKKRFPKAMIKRAYKKAVAQYPQMNAPIEAGLKQLVENEKRGETDFTSMSELFGKCVMSACSSFFSDYSDGDIRLEIIEDVVKCVYLLDIIDDIEKDFKHHNYNPINILCNGKADKSAVEKVASNITSSLSNALSLQMLLPYSDCNSIVKNVLSLGIPFELNRIREKYDLAE